MKKIVSIALIVGMILVSGCSFSDITDQIANLLQSNDEHVLNVKKGHPFSEPDITYGQAFDEFFKSPTWKYFVGTKDGPDDDEDGKPDYVEDNVDIVEFTGYCMYSDVEVKALLQFTLIKEYDAFEATFLSFNNVPQTTFVMGVLIDKVFEEYRSKHSTKSDNFLSSQKESEEKSPKENIEENDTETSKEVLANTSSNVGAIDYDGLMFTIVMYYKNYYGTNSVAAEIDHEDQDTVTIRLYDPYTTTTSNTLGFYIYNKKTGVWTDGIFGEPVDFNASVDSYNEAQETITEYYYAYVNAPDGYVNLRTGPGTEYDIICPIPNGEVLELYNEEATASNGKKWVKVAYYVDGGWNTGWVIASQIEYEKYEAGSSYLYDEYILPYSSEVELTEADLMWLSAQELTYARNEIYARHGYIFKSNELNEYFGSKAWYYPNPEFDGTLYGIELSNANFIREYQEKYGLQYKPN